MPQNFESRAEGGHIERGPEVGQNAEILKHEEPSFSIYLIRHAESAKDKSNPARALTDKGVSQVQEAVNGIVDQLIKEERPEFSEFDSDDKRREVFADIASKIKFRLYDSGTERTLQQTMVELETLRNLGATNFYLPESVKQYIETVKGVADQDGELSGPGVQKRLEGIRGVDQDTTGFRKNIIGNPEYQAEVGAQDELVAWALTPEDKIPEGIESIRVMNERVKENLDKVQAVVPKMIERGKFGGRVVVLANSHASNVTVTTAYELGKTLPEIGEIENAEGVRIDFFADGSEHKARPFGGNIEAKIG